ncbi:MAG: hypothetical protein ABEI86_07765 [Halobacteriaceae archaeon]
MTESGWNAGREPNEEEEKLRNILLRTLDSAEVTHLHDILTGQKQDLESYYTGSTPETQTDEFATQLVVNYQDEIEQFLYREDNHFVHSRINRSTLVEELTNKGTPLSFIEEHDPNYRRFLLLAYHALYDNNDFKQEYERLLAKSRLFKENIGRTYIYDTDEDFDNLEDRVNQFLKSENGPDKRPFTIRVFPSNPELEDQVFLDFYKERPRTYRNVFQHRINGTDGKDKGRVPTITHKPQYPVATLHIRLEITETGQLKAGFKTDPERTGWTTDIRDFFKEVLKINEPLREENVVKATGATNLLQTALDAAGDEDDEEVTDEEIIDAVSEEVERLTETVVENTDEDETKEDVEELKERYESLELVGLLVENDDETLTSRYEVIAQVGLDDYTDQTPGASENITHYLRTVDREKLGLRFRGHIRGENSPDTFVVRDGRWGSDSRIPEETAEKIDRLMQSEEDNKEEPKNG